MSNRGCITNSFDYSGSVAFKIVRNGKTYSFLTHNAGTKELMETIASALAGNDVSNKIPKYMDFVYTSNVDGTIATSLMRNRSPITGATWGDFVLDSNDTNNGSGLLLTSMFTYENKLYVDFNNPNIHPKLVMYSNDNVELASISDRESLIALYDSLTKGNSVIIEWRMLFKNANTGGSN